MNFLTPSMDLYSNITWVIGIKLNLHIIMLLPSKYNYIFIAVLRKSFFLIF
jgi:hypothetical protein